MDLKQKIKLENAYQKNSLPNKKGNWNQQEDAVIHSLEMSWRDLRNSKTLWSAHLEDPDPLLGSSGRHWLIASIPEGC